MGSCGGGHAPALLTQLAAQENKEVYEGEVTELTPEETESAVRLRAPGRARRVT